jgi:carboxymethylenebutenolidase
VPAEEVERGHLARPGLAPQPGVVMIHDVWGLSAHTRDLAGRLASEGFAVLAVDLYRRLPQAEIRDPGAWMRELSDAAVLEELQGAVDFLASGAAAGRRIGVTGFCMGGMYALHAACRCAGLSAAAAFYGMLRYAGPLLEGKPGPAPLDRVAELRCPLLACFGAEDAYIPAADVAELEKRLEAAGPASEVVVYPDAGHAFLNDTRPDAYRPEVASDAWARMLAFFRSHLASGAAQG